ncbi:MAG: nucleoside phosphorylase [Candidatus Aminicenantaceae bacterium]
MNKRIESIVPARPLKEFTKKRVVYFPVDSSSNVIRNELKQRANKEVNLGYSQLYLLKDTVVLYQCIGAPAAVLFLECLIASGAEEIILLGFCGSLNPKYTIKNVVSISKAFSEEGTSRHYFPRRKYCRPSFALKDKIEKILRSSRLSFSEATVVSTDAPCRETKTWLELKQKKGIEVVDMEASAVFFLAEFWSIESAALMIVSDELWSGTWKKGFSDPGLEEKIKEYYFKFL